MATGWAGRRRADAGSLRRRAVVSREGVMIAARDRARRLQAALGEGAAALMGCTLVVLEQPPRRASGTGTGAAAAANEDAAGGAGAASRSAGERAR
jgi:hypothetical protein